VIRDVAIPYEDSARNKALPDFYINEVAQLDSQIAECVSQIRFHKRKRDFMAEFAQSPVDFIEKWTSQQIKDHKVINSSPAEDEETRHGGFYFQPFVEDVVHHYVQNMVITQEK
jgi:SWI/SNF-related matrix-associated actin-dependent regulator of chromatin subfamily D